MAATVFAQPSPSPGAPYGLGSFEREAFSSSSPASAAPYDSDISAILVRKLPRGISDDTLRSMILFAKDFLDAEFISTHAPEDAPFASAIVRFKSLAAAREAQTMLDGKRNIANEAAMVVELLPAGAGAGGSSASTTTTASTSRGQASSSTSSISSAGRQTSSRFSGSGGDLPAPDSTPRFQTLFSPQSPIGNHLHELPRISAKALINDGNTLDDDELLKDLAAYARNGHSAPSSSSSSAGAAGAAAAANAPCMPRRATNPAAAAAASAAGVSASISAAGVPAARFDERFAGLSLATANLAPAGAASSFNSPRTVAGMQTPVSALSALSMGPAGAYQLASQHYPPRANYPPVNPADQNPPCNTLYVGNLPIDTSEDELKAMFCKQRGYKRLCFRTKQNGPMCFVEFEDVSFATKALHDLYGQPLHNSVKGGIRLSFSKNPLGVRSGQPAGAGAGAGLPPVSPLGGAMGGMSAASMPGMLAGHPFASASGPPPGLAAPPGLNSALSMGSTSLNGMLGPANGGIMGAAGFAHAPPGMPGSALRNPHDISSAGSAPAAAFPDYMMGR
ncbi:MAG: hypothetical protein M1829_003331 [Trizodia sp. TS-e1964]|nr:MAG: hypothetical protein M1829_003331 [Trizodia sp. TS-e1964]